MTEPRTPAQQRLHDALQEAVYTAKQLVDDGRVDRAAGLAVAADIGVSACFLFTVTDTDYDRAADVVWEAIHQANRSEP